ncbi:hypothetical protein [Allonocardiopsis opalescens]|uniref:Uncharacterized protein n=1 Tax=Allonocardiopsis opalescens TaxID=1144618 RepID=A0A2T0PYV6_9ACTN|nr:hypothetical protein [Allonocardiopsis opalescens]PRX96692.1 hypothetical protein CLV72_107215 [Allonocardiopsis opalescens]
MTPVTPTAPADAPTRTQDRIGRGINVLNVLATLVALANGILIVLNAPDETLVVETWRTLGYVVFAGMWALLVFWPRSLPGVWELVLFHKIVVTILYFSYGDVPDAVQAGFIDLGVSVATVIAYVLCRGWTSWWHVAVVPAR